MPTSLGPRSDARICGRASSCHPALADEQDVLHPVTLWLDQGLMEVAENTIRCGALHPALCTDVAIRASASSAATGHTFSGRCANSAITRTPRHSSRRLGALGHGLRRAQLRPPPYPLGVTTGIERPARSWRAMARLADLLWACAFLEDLALRGDRRENGMLVHAPATCRVSSF